MMLMNKKKKKHITKKPKKIKLRISNGQKKKNL